MKKANQERFKPTIPFRAKLSDGILTLPKGAGAKIAPRGMTMVEGIMNYIPFRTALEMKGKENRCVKVIAAMRDAVGANDGNTVAVEITRIGDEPDIRVPADLQRALKATPHAEDSWSDITPMARRDWIFSVCTAKQSMTRERRIDKACDMLSSGKRRLCCFPGIKWMMKENAASCGMWLPLPDRKDTK